MRDFIRSELPHNAPSILKDNIIFVNDRYQVNVKLFPDWDSLIQLSIKRLDKQAVHDWRDFQLIKNKICGEEREAVELYPAESRLVDTSNQYYLFVLPKGEKLPFGFQERLVVEGHSDDSKQREFTPDEKPKDCLTLEQAKALAEKEGVNI